MPTTLRATFVLFVLATAGHSQQAIDLATDRATDLAYDLAFDRHQFLWSATLAVAGDRVAYEVRHAPPDVERGDRYLGNGTPSLACGSRIVVTNLANRESVTIPGNGNCWRPAWSPDGRTLAFYSDAAGSVQLWLCDLATMNVRQLGDAVIKAKLWSGDEPCWSPDGRGIYVTLAPDGEYRSPVAPKTAPVTNAAGVTVLQSGGQAEALATVPKTAPREVLFRRENLVALAAVDVQSGAIRIVVGADATPPPAVLRLSASGRRLSYLSVFQGHGENNQRTTKDLAVVSVDGGPVTTVAEELPQLGSYFHANYSWHPRDDLLVFLRDGKLFVVDCSGAIPAAPRQLGAALGELASGPNWFTRDGAAVVVGTDPAGNRPRGLAIVPLDGSAPRSCAIDDGKWRYLGVVKADARTVLQPDDALTLLLLDRKTGERVAGRCVPGTKDLTELWRGRARLSEVTGGGRHDRILGIYEDLSTPPDIWAFTSDFSQKQRVSHIEPRLDAVVPTTAEIFTTTVPSHDGRLEEVRTAVLLPAGKHRGDRLPAIVMMYPGGDVSQQAERFGGGNPMSLPTLLFTSRGYAVVLANLTLGPSGKAGNPMQQMVDVLLPQIYRAAALGYIDLEHLAIGGQSFGGYGTAAIISRTNLFRAAVAVSGIYDLFGTYGHLNPDGGSFWIGWSEGGQARMGTHPWGDVRRYLENSPYYRADKIHTPLLLVHGTADRAYHDAQKLFAALRRLDRSAVLASYADQGHVISEWQQPSAIDAAERMVNFLGQHLGDPRAR